MTAPTLLSAQTVQENLLVDLREARLLLQSSRAAHEHSPNAEREIWLQEVRVRVDGLLDSLLEIRGR